MVKGARLNKRYRGEEVIHAAYLHNKNRNVALQKKTPYDFLSEKPRNNSSIRKFVCAAYSHKHEATRKSK